MYCFLRGGTQERENIPYYSFCRYILRLMCNYANVDSDIYTAR